MRQNSIYPSKKPHTKTLRFFFQVVYKIFKELLNQKIFLIFLKSKLLFENAPSFFSPMNTSFQGQLLNSWLELYHSLEKQPWYLDDCKVWKGCSRATYLLGHKQLLQSEVALVPFSSHTAWIFFFHQFWLDVLLKANPIQQAPTPTGIQLPDLSQGAITPCFASHTSHRWITVCIQLTAGNPNQILLSSVWQGDVVGKFIPNYPELKGWTVTRSSEFQGEASLRPYSHISQTISFFLEKIQISGHWKDCSQPPPSLE